MNLNNFKTSEEIDNESKIELSIKQYQKPGVIIKQKLDPKNGHTVYEIDYINKTIKPAQIVIPNTVNLLTWKDDIKKWTINEKENCIYVSCLNSSNVIKHAKRIIPTEDFSVYTFGLDNKKGGTHIEVNIKNYKSEN